VTAAALAAGTHSACIKTLAIRANPAAAEAPGESLSIHPPVIVSLVW
jgi:hypothetical protein